MVVICLNVFFFEQKTAYEMRISDWSSDVCSSDLLLYSEVVRYSEQIERFVAAFGRENIATVIYDDFAKAPQASYRRVLEFLGVSPDHEPQYAVVNSARVIRSVPLHRWLIKPPIDQIGSASCRARVFHYW